MQDRRALAAFVGLVLIGSGNFVAVRFSNAELPPFFGAALRFAIASTCFALLALAQRASLPRGSALRGAALYGVLGFGASYAFFYWGLVAANAAVGATFLALTPLFTVLLARAHGLEPLLPRALGGAAVAAVGVAVAFVDQLALAIPVFSLAALLASAVAAAESGVVAKGLARLDPIATNLVGMTTGTLVLAALAVATGERLALPTEPRAVAVVLYLGVNSVALFWLYLYVLRRWTASATSYLFVVQPFLTTVLAAALAGEAAGALLLLGGALVVAGVYLGALSPGARSARDEHRRRVEIETAERRA